ncbi:MAG TPA: DMT family transporter [Candidatus Dormibacteraeota bacterium]|nr:DMT family transporter [Candidatus Dormibacteraeota bacterium]
MHAQDRVAKRSRLHVIAAVPVWLPLSLFALVVWAVQRLLSKVALQDQGTRKFYLLSATVSLLTYAPYLVLQPPAKSELLPAFGLACLMAVTFGVTTEAIRRGPLGTVSPITALSPALTAALAILILHERIGPPAYLGVALAPAGIVLLNLGRQKGEGQTGWRALALASLVLQGVGAFVAKLVVTPAGPSALLLMSAAVQVVVGLFLAPPSRWHHQDLLRRPAVFTIVAYMTAGIATIGYLGALASGPASVVVPLVATSPALAGLAGIVVLHERTSNQQLVGITLALAGAVLLAAQA